MGTKIDGLKERITALDLAAQKILRGVQKELGATGGKMEIDAKANHRFKTRSGNLERSIRHDVPEGQMKMTLGFMDDATRSNWKKNPGVTYGTFQHEGTRDGYRQSKAAGKHENTPGRPGIAADHFIVRAWDKHVEGMKERVKKIVFRVIKEAVENGVF
jgi:hypothetical protein